MKRHHFGGAIPLFLFGGGILFFGILAMIQGNIDTLGKVFLGIFLVLVIFLFWLGVKIIGENKRTYQEFYAIFPELETDPNRLEKAATFLDKRLGVAIYKGTILPYNAGVSAFSYVDLHDVESISYRYEYRHVRRTKLPPKAFLDLTLKTEGSPLVSLEMMPILLNVAGHLENLYETIQNEFPDIHCK